MPAWTRTNSAWVDGPGAWQPKGSDQEVPASGLSLVLAVPTAVVPGWTGVDVGSSAMLLAGPGAGISTGQAVRAATGTLRAACDPAAVGLDTAVLCAGSGGLAITANPVVFRDPAWRERRAGRSVAAVSWRAASRPATGAVLASSLGLPVRTS